MADKIYKGFEETTREMGVISIRKRYIIERENFVGQMSIKYWEFEDAPLREKLKNPSIKEVAKIYFDNETRAFRFAMVLSLVKKRGGLRLKDCGADLPVATWKRYLDYGVSVGILKHESNVYSFTDRYSKPLRNISVYIKAWMESPAEEDLGVLFASAKKAKGSQEGEETASGTPL